MNPWDLFTWFMVVLLGGGALIVFGFFLKDIGGVLRGETGPEEDGSLED
ncbi:MAG: hypothetical protein ACRD6R_11720 [Candidatus Polarisedimenticolia bacterium]